MIMLNVLDSATRGSVFIQRAVPMAIPSALFMTGRGVNLTEVLLMLHQLLLQPVAE